MVILVIDHLLIYIYIYVHKNAKLNKFTGIFISYEKTHEYNIYVALSFLNQTQPRLTDNNYNWFD